MTPYGLPFSLPMSLPYGLAQAVGGPVSNTNYILQEDGFKIILEDSSGFILREF